MTISTGNFGKALREGYGKVKRRTKKRTKRENKQNNRKSNY